MCLVSFYETINQITVTTAAYDMTLRFVLCGFVACVPCSIAASLGMLHPDNMSAAGLPMTVRTVYIINPEKVLKLALTYPASTGRNFDEVCAKKLKQLLLKKRARNDVFITQKRMSTKFLSIKKHFWTKCGRRGLLLTIGTR